MTSKTSRQFVLSIYVAGCLLLLALNGCATEAEELRVGANVWPGYEPLFLAQSLGYYEDESIQLITFPSTAEAIRAYRNGAIDVAAVTGDEALQISETMPGQVIILVCDFSNGADVILAKPEFESMTDLRGKRIGVEASALGAYMLARALDVSGMTSQDVTVVHVSLEEHEYAYETGQVDAVVTFEPRSSRLLAAGAHMVFNSSQIPGEIVDVLVARPELVDANDKRLDALIQGWFRALEYLEKYPHDAALRVAPREQATEEVFLKSLQLVTMPSRAENIVLLGNSTNNLERVLFRLHDVMARNKLLSESGDSTLLLDSRFISEAPP